MTQVFIATFLLCYSAAFLFSLGERSETSEIAWIKEIVHKDYGRVLWISGFASLFIALLFSVEQFGGERGTFFLLVVLASAGPTAVAASHFLSFRSSLLSALAAFFGAIILYLMTNG